MKYSAAYGNTKSINQPAIVMILNDDQSSLKQYEY